MYYSLFFLFYTYNTLFDSIVYIYTNENIDEFDESIISKKKKRKEKREKEFLESPMRYETLLRAIHYYLIYILYILYLERKRQREMKT